jgi:hypothetical protein
MTRALRSTLLAGMAGFVGMTLQAAMVPSLSLENVIDQSEVIVHGRVGRTWTAWDNAHKYIWTHHAIEVIDHLRGGGAGPIVASEPGGELNGIGMKFSGSLAYAPGEETILFLYRTPIGYLRATAAGQGKYTVIAGRKVRANIEGRPGLDGLTLESFKARVRESLRVRQ